RRRQRSVHVHVGGQHDVHESLLASSEAALARRAPPDVVLRHDLTTLLASIAAGDPHWVKSKGQARGGSSPLALLLRGPGGGRRAIVGQILGGALRELVERGAVDHVQADG